MNKNEVAGNVLGGLIGAAVAIAVMFAWIKYEDWRMNHAGH